MIKKWLATLMVIMLCAFFFPGGAQATLAWSNWAWGTIDASNILSDAEGENSTFAVLLNTHSGTFPAAGEFLVQVYASSCTSALSCATRETVRCKAVSGGGNLYTLTIKARNQEGTTHSGNWVAGSKVSHAITGGAFNEFGYGMPLINDYVWVGDTSNKPAAITLPTTGTNGCAGTTDKLLYNTANNTFSCGVDQDTGGGGTGYSTIEANGTPLTQRSNVNFIGTGLVCADNAGETQTDCTMDPDLNTIAGLSCSQNQIINKGASTWQCAANPYDAASITTGTLNNSRLSSSVTLQGNTFNGASQLIQTTAASKYPALDGSLITNLPSGFTDPMTTRGDIIYRNGSNVTARFPLCANNEYIGSNGSDLTCMSAGASASDSTWTLHNSYPTACTLPNVVTAIGDTLTCQQPTNVTGSAATLANGDKGEFTCTSGTCVLDWMTHTVTGSPYYLDTITFPKTSGSYTNRMTLGDISGTQIAGEYSYGAHNERGYQAFIGYSATANIISPTEGQMSTTAAYLVAENNYTGGLNVAAYGAYIECRSGNNMFCPGIEVDAQNTTGGTDARIPDPNNILGSGAAPVPYGIWIYNGGTKVPYATYDTSAAIGIKGNVGVLGSAAKWKKGIVVASDAIRSTAGHQEAINLPQGNEIVWYGSNGTDIGRLNSSDGINLNWSGKILTSASTTSIAGFNLPHGTAPNSPVNGDCWTTTAGLYCRINGSTIGPYGGGGSMVYPGAGIANSTGSAWGTSYTTTGSGSVVVLQTSPTFNSAMSVIGSDLDTQLLIQNSTSSAARYPLISVINYANSQTGQPIFMSGNYNGTSASPAATVSGMNLLNFQAMGHTGSATTLGFQMVAQASETFTSANQATILGLYLGSNGGNGTLTQVLAATSSLLTIPITAIINPTVSQSTPFSISGQLITTGSSYPKIMNVNATIKPTATTPWVAGLTFAPSIVRVDASNSYNVSEAFGILARVDLHADYTGTVTSLKQFNIQSAYKGVSGTITTLYGLYVDAITSGGTNYDVYLAGSAAYKATGTTWQNPSDRRLKDNVKPFLDGLDKLLLINPVTYELNGEDGTRKGTKGISVIAQEIQPIFPYMIKSHPGTISGEKTKVLEIDSSAMTWILVNSVKELSTKIKRLEEICKQ